MIPTHADQPINSFYGASKPAAYGPEEDTPNQYPTTLAPSVPVGSDPLAGELKSAYNTDDVHGMHWIKDVDNTYGLGNTPGGKCEAGPTETGPSYMNTFQRGPQESVRETVPQPTCDAFKYGGKNGYLDLFTGDKPYAKQYKYFKKIGNCVGPSTCPAGTGKDASHYLMSWYYAWGDSTDTTGGWSWRIGSSFAHSGYQNPLAAYALSVHTDLKPKSATGAADWSMSLQRQMEFYRRLQSDEGAIAGGSTNSWAGRYATPPFGQWFGFQAWSMERVAEYYQQTGNAAAKAVLDKWVKWARSKTTINPDGSYQIPSTLKWSGQPDTGNASSPGANSGLHVSVADYTDDVGVAAAYAKTLTYYGAKSGDAKAKSKAKSTAKALLDGMRDHHQDSLGIAGPETRSDYSRFNDSVYVPSGWTGRMPNGQPSTRPRRSPRSGPSTRTTRPGRRSRPTSRAAPRPSSPTTGSGPRRT